MANSNATKAITKLATPVCGKPSIETITWNTSSPGRGCIRRGHALAALLAEQGHYGEAEAVCRDDLGLSGRIQRCAQHPDNVWALHGLAECLQRRCEVEELADVQRRLAPAMALADVPIMSSCMCRTAVRIEKSGSCCAGGMDATNR